MLILLVEDDPEISKRLIARLSTHGFIIEHAVDAETALDWPEPDRFVALVVDIGLPGMDGFQFIEKWRERGLAAPILVLSARGSWQEKVDGLNKGADDYIVKPVRAEEVAARLHALIRRSVGHSSPAISVGRLTLNPGTKGVTLEDQKIDLTQIEYRLLHMFMFRAGHILAQSDIMDHLYPMSTERDLNTIEVHIGRLRRKIGRQAISTVRGLGYRLER
jgi:two-component system, OmpR family, response regulator